MKYSLPMKYNYPMKYIHPMKHNYPKEYCHNLNYSHYDVMTVYYNSQSSMTNDSFFLNHQIPNKMYDVCIKIFLLAIL